MEGVDMSTIKTFGAGSIRVKHTLRRLGVAMAGRGVQARTRTSTAFRADAALVPDSLRE
jgi:hypothetical protein